ncbi:methyltransferase domain-containing protein [Methanocalculus sp. MC3]
MDRMNSHNSEEKAYPPAPPEAIAREVIIRLGLKGHERVLHIGSDDGTLTAAIAACLPRGKVTGIESSVALLTSSEVAYGKNRYNNVVFQKGELADMAYQSEFDSIICLDALNRALDPARAIGSIRNALADGGRLLLQVEGTGPSEEMLAGIQVIISDPAWKQYFTGDSHQFLLFGKDEVARLAEAAGITLSRADLARRVVLLRDAGALSRWIEKSWRPLIGQVPGERREEFISALAERYHVLYPPSGDGSFQIPVSRITLEGRVEQGST